MIHLQSETKVANQQAGCDQVEVPRGDRCSDVDRCSGIGQKPFVDQGEQYENEMSKHKIDLVVGRNGRLVFQTLELGKILEDFKL